MKLAYGTYSRLARELGCSVSLVQKVATGLRRNARIELALENALRKQVSQERKLQRLRRLNRKQE